MIVILNIARVHDIPHIIQDDPPPAQHPPSCFLARAARPLSEPTVPVAPRPPNERPRVGP